MDESETVRIRELDLNTIPPNVDNMDKPEQGGVKLAFIGKPGTGKSTLIESVLYSKKHIFPMGIAMSGTEDSNGFYGQFFPPAFVYPDSVLNEGKVEEFIKRQKLAKKHLKNPWGVLIIDDLTDDPKVFNRPLFHGIFKNGRHWKMMFILSLQYCMDIRPAIRNAIDGTFILRETNLKSRKSLWENFAGCIPDFNTFCDIMDGITGDRTALFINNMIDTGDWKDRIFYYNADWYMSDPSKTKGFKFGCQDYWDFNKERFNPASVDTM